MPCLFHALGDLLQQLRRARMQGARFLVDEERHRHAPLALARGVQSGRLAIMLCSRACPRREELGGLDAGQRGLRAALGPLSDRVHVHPREPLRGGAGR